MTFHAHSQSAGFTLVETLVAIAILMIAIAGPLTVANQALTAALGARDTMIASYLAEEGMESIKNIKDNNVANGLSYWEGICSSPSSCTNNPSGYAIPESTEVGGIGLSGDPCPSYTDCQLYSGGGTAGYYYAHRGSGGTLSPFTRSYSVSKYTSADMLVAVVVSWYEGTIPNAITLQELMSSSPR